MRITHHFLLSGSLALLVSCGGGGGGSNDPMEQPASFLPEGVTEATLVFQSGGDEFPKSITLKQKAESTGEKSATWTATVSSEEMSVPGVNDGTTLIVKLVGEVKVTRQAGQQGFLLEWSGKENYAAGEAGLDGSMVLSFFSVDDNSGTRRASVSVPSVRLVYSDNETELYKVPRLDGTSVEVSFTPVQQPQSQPTQ